jgi:membrane-anchored protein YejM (alkaline phosphatase superfamily)
MKNLFLALAVMLVSTFAFANNSVEKKLKPKQKKLKIRQIMTFWK